MIFGMGLVKSVTMETGDSATECFKVKLATSKLSIVETGVELRIGDGPELW